MTLMGKAEAVWHPALALAGGSETGDGGRGTEEEEKGGRGERGASPLPCSLLSLGSFINGVDVGIGYANGREMREGFAPPEGRRRV